MARCLLREQQNFVGSPLFPWGAYSRLSHTSDLNIGTSVATLQESWHQRVGNGTGWPGGNGCDSQFDVWLHIQLLEHICPQDTLACC